jgi:hypothetical protein
MARTVDRDWAMQVVVGGLVAGITFAAFEMIISALLSGAQGFWMPLRMIAAILLGSRALEPSYPLASAVPVGLLIHIMLSVGFALMFFAVVQPRSTIWSSSGLLVSSSIFGCILWIVNFYVIALALDLTWFPDSTNPLVQFLAHTFFYGCVLGVALNRSAIIADLLGPAEGPPSRV